MPAVPRRLAGLEGLRGLAALFVVVHHVFLRAFPGYPADRAPVWAAWLIYGRFAVVVFIVLSGFSLALEPARRGWHLDGIGRFAVRRARRIVPAYWAALLLSIAVARLVLPPPGQPLPDARSAVVDGLLVQNLVAAPTPNKAFWSIAVEAQLYLLFPLLLVLVRRRGATAMLAAVTAVVVAIGVAAPHVHRLDVLVIQSAPDFAALFALGVLTAGIVRAGDGRRSWPWARMALVLAAAVAGVIAWKGSVWTLDRLFWVDLAVAPAVACLLAGLATGRPAWLLRLLDTRPLRRLGDCSYSLYLVHGPIVVVVYQKAIAGSLGHGAAAFAVAASISVPLAVVCARAFASVFEHPRRTPAVRQSAWYRSERAYRRSTTSPI